MSWMISFFTYLRGRDEKKVEKRCFIKKYVFKNHLVQKKS
jgi:hypothetical protein